MKFAKTLTGLLAVGMLFGLSAQNLVENSSFENGISQWAPPAWKRPDGRIWLTPQEDKTVSQGAGGTASMKLDWNKNNVVYIWYYKEILLNGLQEVELSFWAKSVGYNDANITEIEVSFPEVKDPKAKREIVGNAWNRVPKDWTLFKKQFKVPAGATKAKLCIRFHGFKSQKGTSWIDNVYFGAVQKDDGQSAKK